MLRGINRESIFQEPEDCDRFLQVLRQCKAICGLELFAWCLMDNHVHLLMRAGEEPLALVMKRIGCRYVYWYNKKYDRIGHLFQDRFRLRAADPYNADSRFSGSGGYRCDRIIHPVFLLKKITASPDGGDSQCSG